MAVDSSLKTHRIARRTLRYSTLTSTKTFTTIYRRGRWVKGLSLSIGAIENDILKTRIGVRTRRGLKGAVRRNRLKRQIRGILQKNDFCIRSGVDIILAIHPTSFPARTTELEAEFRLLCARLRLLS